MHSRAWQAIVHGVSWFWLPHTRAVSTVALDEKRKLILSSIILMTPLFEKFVVLLQQPGILLCNHHVFSCGWGIPAPTIALWFLPHLPTWEIHTKRGVPAVGREHSCVLASPFPAVSSPSNTRPVQPPICKVPPSFKIQFKYPLKTMQISNLKVFLPFLYNTCFLYNTITFCLSL